MYVTLQYIRSLVSPLLAAPSVLSVSIVDVVVKVGDRHLLDVGRSLPEAQGAPRQGYATEWVFRQATQVTGVHTKQLVAPDCRCRTSLKPVL